MSDDAIITRLELLRKYLEDKLNMSAYINPDGKYIRVIYGGISVCKIYMSGDGYNIEYSHNFLMDGSARKEQYVCLERDIPIFIRNRVDYYENYFINEEQTNMSKLKELRDYLLENVRWNVTFEIIFDKLKIYDSESCICYITEAYGGGFNIHYYSHYNFDGWDPHVCKANERFVCTSINDRIKKYNQDHARNVAKYMNNRINVNVDNDTVTKQIYMMSARGNGKTQWVSEQLKKVWPCKDNIKNNIKDVIFNDPATIVFWTDGTKTVVKCQPGETFDPEKGLAMAISKRVLGNDYGYYETFAKHVGRYNKKHKEK